VRDCIFWLYCSWQVVAAQSVMREHVVMYTSMSTVEIAISFMNVSWSLPQAAYSAAVLVACTLLGSTGVVSSAVSILRE